MERTTVTIPPISHRGDGMLSYKGRTVYLIWEEQEDVNDEPAGFAPLRLLADGSLSMPMGTARSTDLREAVERAFMVLGYGPFEDGSEEFWEDVAGTSLDTRTQTVAAI